MPSLPEFLKFLTVSPPSGLIIAKKKLMTKKARMELSQMKRVSEIFEVTKNSDVVDFFKAVDKVLKQNAWLVLDIKTADIPGWLYEQMRTLGENGHLYNKDQDKDIRMGDSRVLAIISEENLEECPFETFQADFGIVFRT